jgi:hypothetical protein
MARLTFISLRRLPVVTALAAAALMPLRGGTFTITHT